jgi:hypothetical protein
MSNVMVQPGTSRTIKNLPPLTPKQLRDAERDKLYIFNTGPRVHRTDICGKRWTIPACPEGQDVSEPMEIPGAYYFTDVAKVHGLDVDYKWVTVDGTELARDIIGTSAFRHESEDLTRFGVFISETPDPSESVCEAARQRWYDRCGEKVREADDAYAINGGMVTLPNGRSVSSINRDHLEAAKILGVEEQKPWAKKNVRLVACDECGTGNVATAAFCKQCDNMLSAEAAQRKFPVKYAERMGASVAPDAAPEAPAKRPYNRRGIEAA